jgi:hypothetical protein
LTSQTAFNYDFRDPIHLYFDNDILKSNIADTIYLNKCVHCHKTNHILLNNTHLSRWKDDMEYAQNVFHWLSADDREVLMTGIHPECWNEIYPDND